MKKTALSIGSILFVGMIILLLVIQPWGKKPFKKLSANDISSVSVKLVPPDEEYDLSNDEIAELIDILNDVVIYKKDSTYNKYDGQAVIYSITKMDGTIIEINAYNPFLIIDGVGYKTKYEPCEALNALGNKIRNRK